MNFPRIFDHPVSLWDSFQDDGGFFSRLRHLPRTHDDNGDMAFMPPCDISENKDNFKVRVELPGIDKDDISVSLKDGVLHIEAATSSEKEDKEGEKVIRSECRYGKYIRRFNLGKNVSDDDIKAKFNNGVLDLTIPKLETVEEKSKKIAIE